MEPSLARSKSGWRSDTQANQSFRGTSKREVVQARAESHLVSLVIHRELIEKSVPNIEDVGVYTAHASH